MRHGRLKPNIFLKPENDPSLSFQNVDVVNKSKLASHKTAYTIDTQAHMHAYGYTHTHRSLNG